MLRQDVELGLDCFEPFDLDHNPAHNILDDTAFEALLKLCWSGAVALIMLAPPCKEYSRLKLRPGGPKALRTPQHMHGVPGLSPCQQKKLADIKATHERGRLLFTAVVLKGGLPIWEQPPLSMSWLEAANFHMLREHQCTLVWVDACQHGKTFTKSWAFGSNSPRITALMARCNHTFKHPSIAGIRENGVYLSSLTAEYPPSLARQLAAVGTGRMPRPDLSCRRCLCRPPFQGHHAYRHTDNRCALEQVSTHRQTGLSHSHRIHCVHLRHRG